MLPTTHENSPRIPGPHDCRRLLTGLAIAACAAGASAQYQLTPIPLLPSANAGEALGVNNLGQVVGRDIYATPNHAQGFVFDHGLVTDIGQVDFGGATTGNLDLWGFDGVFDINDSGEAVGTLRDAVTGLPAAFRWDGAIHEITLPLLPPGAGTPHSRGFAINSAGAIAGGHQVRCVSGATPIAAARWSPGGASLVSIPTCVDSTGYGINDAGWVVGQSNSQAQPFLWNGLGPTPLSILGSSGGADNAVGINDVGEIVGWSFDPSTHLTQACRWNASSPATPPLTLGSVPGQSGGFAFSINNHSQVVGASGSTTFNSGLRAFRWQSGVIEDLNSLIPPGSGWTLQVAYDVSDSGFIVGVGDPPGSVQQQAYLLEPCALTVLGAPISQTVARDSTITLTATVSGAGPLTLTWNNSSGPIAAHTTPCGSAYAISSTSTGSSVTSTLTITHANWVDGGDYWVSASGACGSITTPAVHVAVDCLADVDNDRQVGESDLGALLAAWELCGSDAGYNVLVDFDCSGCIDSADLGTLLAQFGATCP
ncbi:MAG: hypothetical protein U1D55_11430 [Phycisphaerae bacterium]